MLDASDGLRFGVGSASVADDVFDEVVEDMFRLVKIGPSCTFDQHSTVMKSFFF